MSIQGSISISSVQAEISQISAKSERQAVAYRSNSNPSSPASFLNAQENQIVDDVNISDAAVKQLEQARALNDQLQSYLDYLKGNDQNKTNVRLVPTSAPTQEIAARATSLEASITAGKVTESNIDIDFTLDDNGDLSSLSVEASKTTTEFVSTSYTLSDTAFYASRA